MPDLPRPVFARPVFWLCLVLVLLAGTSLAWLVMPVLARNAVLAAFGLDSSAVRIEFVGRVVDANGRPVAGANVAGTWKTIGADSEASGTVSAVCDAEGRYRQIAWFGGEHLDKASNLKVRAVLRAHGRSYECEPTPAKELETPARSTLATDLQLGAPLPLVPVHVRDAAGKPVTEFWLAAIPANETTPQPVDWPRTFKDFPTGVAQLGVPKQPFRVEAYRYGGADRTMAGPYDPAALPERIEITLGK